VSEAVQGFRGCVASSKKTTKNYKKTTKTTKNYKKQLMIGRYTISAVTFWVMSEAWSWY
jgi:hypothetical protein